MDEKQKQTLEKIIQQFDSLLNDLKELLASDEVDISVTNSKERKYSYIDSDTIQKLKGMGRLKTEEYLKSLKAKELGDILRKIGGSSEETKRPKDTMINNILYKIFDFNTGHSIIKGETN
jgi:Asp-tRNA(Asn)/Glu-tRNA(Gln) amidotransferase C subunit